MWDLGTGTRTFSSFFSPSLTPTAASSSKGGWKHGQLSAQRHVTGGTDADLCRELGQRRPHFRAQESEKQPLKWLTRGTGWRAAGPGPRPRLCGSGLCCSPARSSPPLGGATTRTATVPLRRAGFSGSGGGAAPLRPPAARPLGLPPAPRQHPTHGSVGSCARRPCQGPRQHCGIGFSVLNAEFRIPKIRPRAAQRRQGPRSRDRAPPQSIPAALMNERATALSTGTRKCQRCFVDSKSFFLALKQNTFTF